MLDFLNHILSGQNQFASGGLLLMIVGGLGVYLRALPLRFWSWFVDQTVMMITVKDDDLAFVWVKEWFLEQKFLKRIRRVDLDTTLRGEELALIPAPGGIGFGMRAGRSACGFFEARKRKAGACDVLSRLRFEPS